MVINAFRVGMFLCLVWSGYVVWRDWAPRNESGSASYLPNDRACVINMSASMSPEIDAMWCKSIDEKLNSIK